MLCGRHSGREYFPQTIEFHAVNDLLNINPFNRHSCAA